MIVSRLDVTDAIERLDTVLHRHVGLAVPDIHIDRGGSIELGMPDGPAAAAWAAVLLGVLLPDGDGPVEAHGWLGPHELTIRECVPAPGGVR